MAVRHWFMPTEFCWLVELPARPLLYLHPARSETSLGFTEDPLEAQRFPNRAAAQAEIDLYALDRCVPAEHGFG